MTLEDISMIYGLSKVTCFLWNILISWLPKVYYPISSLQKYHKVGYLERPQKPELLNVSIGIVSYFQMVINVYNYKTI